MANLDNQVTKPYTESDREITELILNSIKSQYPGAYEALRENYNRYKMNMKHFKYLCVHRFIRCNFGKIDQITWDVEGGVLHVEDTRCPLKFSNDCTLKGKVCNPLPYGLSKRETEIARLRSSGFSHQQISDRLGIAKSTINHVLRTIKIKLGLKSARDLAKLFVVAVNTTEIC